MEDQETNENELILVNFKMKRKDKKRLEDFCEKNDMTLTAGIKRAIRKMLENEDK